MCKDERATTHVNTGKSLNLSTFTSNFYNGASPLFSPSILADQLPNCMAFFFLRLASNRPSFLAARRRSILSPYPTSSLGSIFTETGSPARKSTTLSERKGYLVSFPCEEMTRSSRPRFRVGMRDNSSWSYMHSQGMVREHTSTVPLLQQRPSHPW